MTDKLTANLSGFLHDLLGVNAADADVAFLITRTNYVYFSIYKPQIHEPRSAVTELIQGIWETYGVNAVTLVRNRIYSTALPNEMDYGMLKVCGKRMSPAAEFFDDKANIALVREIQGRTHVASHLTPSASQNNITATEPVIYSNANALAKARTLFVNSNNSLPLAARDRQIGAVLLSSGGKLLATGANRAGSDRTRHAEVNLLQDYFRRTQSPVPYGATLVTTRKPCKMCAAMLWHASDAPLSLKVFYEEFDPGPLASMTILNANSFERNRACAHDHEIGIELESKLEE